MAGITLLYISSAEIVRFVTKNPINWLDRYKEYAMRGGYGDQAGVTPTPAVEEFLRLLTERKRLFTQGEYVEWCRTVWGDWRSGLSTEQAYGVKAKLFRNFYPSMIDSLHVWSLLSESGEFDSCVLNSHEDAIGKTDLTVFRGNEVIRLALMAPGSKARADRNYKIAYRATDRDACIELPLDLDAPKSPGNKRWYTRTGIMDAIYSQPESVATKFQISMVQPALVAQPETHSWL